MKKIVSGLFGVVVAVMGCEREIGPVGGETDRDFFVLTGDEIALLAGRDISPKLDRGEIDRVLDDVRRLMDDAASPSSLTFPDPTADPSPDPSPDPSATRSAPAARTVARIRPITVETSGRGTTRGGGSPDTLFHIVDFADGMGYCIVSADRRLPDPVVCFVDAGSFPAVEVSGPGPVGNIDNPGLAVMIDAVRNYALRSLQRRREWADSVTTALLARTGAASLDDIDPTRTPTRTPIHTPTRVTATPFTPAWRFNRRVGPLLPVEWGQGSPFNTTVVENTPWNTTPAGCVALAAVQVMAYWKFPSSLPGLDTDRIDWDELRRWSGPQWDREGGYGEWDGPMSSAPDATRRLVADILWLVGSGIGMRYGPSVSTAYTSQVVSLLAEAGFSQGRTTPYTHGKVIGQLSAGRPVMIDAASHRSVHGSHANAHAWVIDGFLEDRWWDAFTIDRHVYRVERFRWFLHSNFGWGGVDNGYYAAGVFDANNNPDLPSSTTATPSPATAAATRAEPTWKGENYNYQFMQTIYVDIYK